jgi:hypothetical protein
MNIDFNMLQSFIELVIGGSLVLVLSLVLMALVDVVRGLKRWDE